MMKKVYLIFILGFFMPILISGCVSDQPPQPRYFGSMQNTRKFRSIKIVAAPCQVPVISEAHDKLQEYLAQGLYDQARFEEGNELTLRYRFSNLSIGNKNPKGFVSGAGNCGVGTVVVDVVYIDAFGNQIGCIRSEKQINAGFYGWSFFIALERAAEEITKHAAYNYRA